MTSGPDKSSKQDDAYAPSKEVAEGEFQHGPPPAKTNSRARKPRVLIDAWRPAGFIILLIPFIVLAVAAHSNPHFTWDVSLAERIQSFSAPGFWGLMAGVSFLGESPAAWIAVFIAGLGLWWAGRKLEAAVCTLGSAIGSAVDTLLKLAIARPRPSAPLVHVMKHYEHKSFPSGHVFFFMEFFGFLLFLSFVLLRPSLFRRFAVLGLLGLIVLVGISRVYLGAHWPSDVVGGYLAGGAWLMLMIEAYKRLKPARVHERYGY